MPSPESTNIHHRRRWFYVLWTGLLLGALGLWFWTEQPTGVGVARLEVALTLRDVPAGGRAALWIGRLEDQGRGLAMPLEWVPVQESKVTLISPVRMAMRRLGHTYMLRRTDDFCVVVIETSGQRRYFRYDLRQDIAPNLLKVGRRLQLRVETHWASLSTIPDAPLPTERPYIGW